MPRVLRSICWPQDALLAIWRFAGFIFLLGIFNLLPVGVLDGGQILRCFLQKRMEISRADFWQRTISFLGAQDWRYWLR